MKGYSTDIEKDSLDNTNFRTVLHTTEHMQLVVMSIPIGGEIGEEVHPDNDQFIRVEGGTAEAQIDNATYPLKDGSIIMVPAGAKHNVINTSDSEDLKVYTIYAPPHHKDGVVHATKQDADNDESDHFDGKVSEPK